MLHFSRWATAAILAILVVGAVLVAPNFFSKTTIASWPSWMPKQQVVLGLDLQGGVYLLYEIDRDSYVDSRLTQLQGDIRTTLRTAPAIGYTGLARQGNAVQLTVDPSQVQAVTTRLQALRNPLGSSLLGANSNYEFDITGTDAGVIRMAYSDASLATRVNQIAQQSIEVINRRINQLGTVEPNIQRQGTDRILVEAPGLTDPDRLKDLIGQTAEMTFHLVQSTVAMSPPPDVPADAILVPDATDPTIGYILDSVALIRGDNIVTAQSTFDSQTNTPVVSFRLNASGGRTFANVTQSNVNKQFAIVLDNKVISAPRIISPILGGQGQIQGNFTVEEANNLAILLRAGALPAKLTIVEQRTIGASLGANSIHAGIIATGLALVFIAVFMIVCYGLLGAFSVVALVGQIILMFAVLTVLGSTLTLPGIAGIVLTMAMAVDANVLIYERMREEKRAGRSVVTALDQGFRRALATIVDAHLTALIAAVALFALGSGPIRGFAVTLGVGILSTLFTAYLITRLIVSVWFRRFRPKVIPL